VASNDCECQESFMPCPSSHPYLLLQYALSSLIMTEQFSLLK